MTCNRQQVCKKANDDSTYVSCDHKVVIRPCCGLDRWRRGAFGTAEVTFVSWGKISLLDRQFIRPHAVETNGKVRKRHSALMTERRWAGNLL